MYEIPAIKIIAINIIYSAITIEKLLSFQTNEHENGTSQATLCSTFALQYCLEKGRVLNGYSRIESSAVAATYITSLRPRLKLTFN